MEAEDQRKSNLVKAGPYSRVIEYSVNDGIEQAIREVFSDVPRIVNAASLVLQWKDVD